MKGYKTSYCTIPGRKNFLIFLHLLFFPWCVESLVTESGTGNLGHLGSFPSAALISWMSLASPFFACILGLSSAECGRAVSLPVFLSQAWTLRINCYRLPDTKRSFPVSFPTVQSCPSNCMPASSNSSWSLRWWRQKSHASEPNLHLQSLEVGSSLALGTNSSFAED